MTPMKKLSNGLNILKYNIKPYFKEIILNKKESQYSAYIGPYGQGGYTKAVEQDFVNILQSNFRDISFAFSYTYIDLLPEKHRIYISIKEGKDNDNIIYSHPLTIDEFKVKLNSFNREFINTSLNESDILKKVRDIFLQNTFDLKEEVNQADKNINNFIQVKSASLNITALEEEADEASKKLSNAQFDINHIIKNSDEYKRIEEIKKEIILLSKKQEELRQSLEKEKKISTLVKIMQSTSNKLGTARFLLKNEIDEEIKKLPNSVAKKIKFK